MNSSFQSDTDVVSRINEMWILTQKADNIQSANVLFELSAI